jgi:hypothetical protein
MFALFCLILLKRTFRLFLIGCSLLSTSFLLSAQSISSPTVVLKSVRLYDGKSDRLTSPGTINYCGPRKQDRSGWSRSSNPVRCDGYRSWGRHTLTRLHRCSYSPRLGLRRQLRPARDGAHAKESARTSARCDGLGSKDTHGRLYDGARSGIQ